MNNSNLAYKVFIMENHNEAYTVWKAFCIKDKILVHVDAHIDFAWFAEHSPEQLLSADNLKELDSFIKSVKVWNPSPSQKDTHPNIGNYIYSAVKDGIVKKFFWVVPNDFLNTGKKLRLLKSFVQRLAGDIPGHKPNVTIDANGITGYFPTAEVRVCDLASLPNITESALLDIDTDFLLTDFKTKHSVYLFNSKKNLPWIWPRDLVEILRQKIRPEITTIAYSVEGYFTPLEFKYLGDYLKALFGSPELEKNNLMIYELINKAMVNKNTGFLEGAIESLKEAIALNPDLACAYYNLALILYEQGLFEQARQNYQKAIILNKTYRTRYNNLGFLYSNHGRYDKMKEEFDKLLNLDPQNCFAHAGIGEYLFIKKRFEDAKKKFKVALSLDSSNNESRYLLSKIYIREKNFLEAIALLEETIAQDPGYLDAYLTLAKTYQRTGLAKKAISNYRMAIRLGFCNARLCLDLGLLYIKTGALQKAIGQLLMACRICPVEFSYFLKDIFLRTV